MKMYIKRYVEWNDIKENAWAGAAPVCEEIEKQGREEEAMDIIESVFCEGVPDETDVNDLLWFDLADMMKLYDEDEDDEEDEEEDED